jgi:hypothetical protein
MADLKPCTNVMHDSLNCPEAGIPRKQWCENCKLNDYRSLVGYERRLHRMGRQQLIRECERLGLRFADNQTRSELLERIRAAQGLDKPI